MRLYCYAATAACPLARFPLPEPFGSTSSRFRLEPLELPPLGLYASSSLLSRCFRPLHLSDDSAPPPPSSSPSPSGSAFISAFPPGVACVVCAACPACATLALLLEARDFLSGF